MPAMVGPKRCEVMKQGNQLVRDIVMARPQDATSTATLAYRLLQRSRNSSDSLRVGAGAQPHRDLSVGLGGSVALRVTLVSCGYRCTLRAEYSEEAMHERLVQLHARNSQAPLSSFVPVLTLTDPDTTGTRANTWALTAPRLEASSMRSFVSNGWKC